MLGDGSEGEEGVVVCMGNEFAGSTIRTTTLKNLQPVMGKVDIRFFYKKPKVKGQARETFVKDDEEPDVRHLSEYRDEPGASISFSRRSSLLSPPVTDTSNMKEPDLFPVLSKDCNKVESEIRKLDQQEKQQGHKSFKKGQWADALGSYSKAIEKSPKDPKIFLYRAICYMKMKKFNLALQDCDKSKDLDPVNAYADFRNGIMLQSMGQISKDRELDPDSLEATTGYKLSEVLLSEKTRETTMKGPQVQQIMGVKSSTSRPHPSTCSSAKTGTHDDEQNLS
ncbi:stress-induced-phosphoprotein 1, partial [Eurytemora carolleeae]|uniref:stress-induced-phosphoprotein 1 n=1 Tax=Eurytemora carolleeae TaxID=1294199 RepID=UPI000C75B086